MKEQFKKALDLLKSIREMPKVNVNLMLDKCEDNDPFYRKVTLDFFKEATSRHPKFPLVKKLELGIALYNYTGDEDEYFNAVESSARRNFKKASRNGFVFKKINYNDYIDDVWEIRKSAHSRQGKMPEELIKNRPKESTMPKTKTHYHDYPYYGVLNEDGKLVAYAGCLVTGEMAAVEHVYGHAEFQNFGIVPMLYIAMAKQLKEDYPSIRFYSYGTFLGASDTLKRFKKKFQFKPHKVNWILQ